MLKQSIRIFIILILHISLMNNSQTKAQEPSGEDPNIISSYIGTFHDKNNYRIDASAEVIDPQGEDDINTVKVIDVNGGEFNLHYFGSNSYYANSNLGQTLPPFGDTRIVATDKSGNSCTVHHNLTNVVEQLPTILFPEDGALISDTEPVFDWTDVLDEQSTIAYSLAVYRHDTGELIWQLNNIAESQALYNLDGNASESLQEGLFYDLEITAFDTLGNSSYAFITFSIGSYKILENDIFIIRFHPYRPYIEQCTSKTNNGIIYGDIVNEMFSARVFFQDEFYDIVPSLNSITQASDQIYYHMRIDIDSELAVTFDLSYILNENTVQITFGNVTEESGYRLIYVRSPDLMTIRGVQPNAKLVVPYAEGRLIDVATSDPGYVDLDLDASGWSWPLLMGMLYHNELAGIVSYDHLDMLLWERIYDDVSEGRLCSIGMNFNFRYAPTNFTSAAFIDIFDSVTSELSMKLTFTGDYDGDQDIDWIDGAKVLRAQVEATPNQMYLSSFITKSCAISPTDGLEPISKIYHLTDHNKNYSYLLAYHPCLKHIFGTEVDFAIIFWNSERAN